ncbi:MAG: YIP1 family protein [Methanoregulaceae archaeon]|jgi:hypothetical protein|nr:YIP1 family protein [Methanoregulaceae archaeon]
MPKITDVILSPDTFFAEKMQSAEEIRFPLIIVLITGIIGAITGYMMGELTARMFAGVGAGMGEIVLVSSFAGAFFGVLLMWIAGTGILYLLSMVFKGTGGFKRALEFIGWGFIPQVFSAIIGLLVALYYFPMVQVPVLRSFQDPAVMQSAINHLMNDPSMLQYRQISSIISIIFILWSASIWIFGMKHARKLSTKNAAIVVLVPVLIYIISIVYTIFSGIPAPGV